MQSGPEPSAGMGAEHSSMSGDDKIMKLVGDGLAVRRFRFFKKKRKKGYLLPDTVPRSPPAGGALGCCCLSGR